MEARILVGCCGFPVARKKYFEKLGVVEVQQTFYKLPRPETVKKWREEAPPGFIYTMKAWQAVTHPPTSPTWRKAGLDLKSVDPNRYGFLRPTPENFEAWRKTLEIARILEAEFIVVQTPPSFGFSEENVSNALEFFRKIERDPRIEVGWEPRGSWRKYPEAVKMIVEETGTVHVVDPFKWWPPVDLGKTRTVYLRLHGRGERETNYNYIYTKEDYIELCNVIREAISKGAEKVYVMFNNKHMFKNAIEFKEYVTSSCS